MTTLKILESLLLFWLASREFNSWRFICHDPADSFFTLLMIAILLGAIPLLFL